MRTFVFIFVCVMLIWGFFSCVDSSADPARGRSGDVALDAAASSGLDLQALVGLAKTAKDAEDLERKLNEPGGINNLDLNEDEQVDYIAVTEYGNRDAWGFSLTTEPEEGQVQEVATIEMERQGENQARISANGSPNIYGPLMTYMVVDTIGDIIMWNYLLNRTSPWRSSYRYGRYPSYYRSYRPVGYNSYYTRTRSLSSMTKAQRVSTPRTSTLTSPNSGKVASSGIKKSLAQPTRAQKSFQARNPSKAVKSGGFGRSSSSRSARSSSSSRGFGGRGK
ncbi:MAG: hypothetical protein QNK37_34530 [Acidobacteriota bacterium]|nr:hypothetical protein [Acidobacteriota bacterium]